MVRHHLNPVKALQDYDVAQLILPDFPNSQDFKVTHNAAEQAAIANANELAPIDLTELEITAILAFLETLSDADSLTGRLGIPSAVPSGLPVDQ